MTISEKIGEEESLGRGVFSSRETKEIRRRKAIPHSVYLEKLGVAELSVQRVDGVASSELAGIGDRLAGLRGSNRSFYGWAVIKNKDASESGRVVVAAPNPDSIHHADIILPDSAVGDREAQLAHANELAAFSEWHERGD